MYMKPAEKSVCDLTIMILAKDEAENLKVIIPQTKKMIEELSLSYEIIVVDGKSRDDTSNVAASLGARVVVQEKPGYGEAFRLAFREARGEYVLNLDADCSHNPKFIKTLWDNRASDRLVIASRYMPNGGSKTSIFRHILSIILNLVYAKIFLLPYKDLSSGYRLYHAPMVRDLIDDVEAQNFDILLEILIKLHKSGASIIEVPFRYEPRKHGHSNARLLKFAVSYAKTLIRTSQWKCEKKRGA